MTAAVYCGACGAGVTADAKFCGECGAAQGQYIASAAAPSGGVDMPGPGEAAWRLRPPTPPPPLAPPPAVVIPGGAQAQAATGTAVVVACMAILGGLGMCLITLYAVVYLPLHYHFGVNYGDSPQFGDVLVFGSGAAAIALGVVALVKLPRLPAYMGVILPAAGLPTLILVGVFALHAPLEFIVFSRPFYFGSVYFANFGLVHIGSGVVSVPLLIASTMVSVAGIVALVSASSRRAA